MTAAWAAAAMLDALRAEVAAALDDEHTGRQMTLEAAAAKLATVAVAFHTSADQAAEGEDAEPYCTVCGSWIGIFHGPTGWRRFRSVPAPGGHRELYEAGHEAVPAWCIPPGRPLSPAQARTIGQALTDAIGYRLAQAGGRCADCAHHPARTCPGHASDTSRAVAYRQAAVALATATPPLAAGKDPA